MTTHPLDRSVWTMLTTRQSVLARGDRRAWRIDPGYGPFAAARDQGDEAMAALAALIRPGEQIWLVETEEWSAPSGLVTVRTASLAQMVAEQPMPLQPGDDQCVLLGEDDAAEMAELALANEPGPWRAQTRRYGQFYGVRRDGRLAAMAGMRMLPGDKYAEVSGVCTWPEYRGQGLAAQLIRQVMAGFTARGLTPFLHSYAGNAKAIGLYEALGFRTRRAMVVTVLERG